MCTGWCGAAGAGDAGPADEVEAGDRGGGERDGAVVDVDGMQGRGGAGRWVGESSPSRCRATHRAVALIVSVVRRRSPTSDAFAVAVNVHGVVVAAAGAGAAGPADEVKPAVAVAVMCMLPCRRWRHAGGGGAGRWVGGSLAVTVPLHRRGGVDRGRCRGEGRGVGFGLERALIVQGFAAPVQEPPVQLARWNGAGCRRGGDHDRGAGRGVSKGWQQGDPSSVIETRAEAVVAAAEIVTQHDVGTRAPRQRARRAEARRQPSAC